MTRPEEEDEMRVAELVAAGLTQTEARREARAERAEKARLQQFSKRNTQANTRIFITIFRFIMRMFK